MQYIINSVILFYINIIALYSPLELDGGDGREVQEGGDMCIHIAGSLRCTAETNTTL